MDPSRRARPRAAVGRRTVSSSPDDDPSYLREYEHLTLARLLIAEYRRDGGDIDGALGLLDRLLSAAEDGGRIGQRHRGAAAAGDRAERRRLVLRPRSRRWRRAVTLAEPEGYVRLFTDEGPALAALLKTLRRQPSAPGYVNRLIAATTTSRLRPAPRNRWSSR